MLQMLAIEEIRMRPIVLPVSCPALCFFSGVSV